MTDPKPNPSSATIQTSYHQPVLCVRPVHGTGGFEVKAMSVDLVADTLGHGLFVQRLVMDLPHSRSLFLHGATWLVENVSAFCALSAEWLRAHRPGAVTLDDAKMFPLVMLRKVSPLADVYYMGTSAAAFVNEVGEENMSYALRMMQHDGYYIERMSDGQQTVWLCPDPMVFTRLVTGVIARNRRERQAATGPRLT
jgi:hypothetical protein